jgi:hypothetical protein
LVVLVHFETAVGMDDYLRRTVHRRDDPTAL